MPPKFLKHIFALNSDELARFRTFVKTKYARNQTQEVILINYLEQILPIDRSYRHKNFSTILTQYPGLSYRNVYLAIAPEKNKIKVSEDSRRNTVDVLYNSMLNLLFEFFVFDGIAQDNVLRSLVLLEGLSTKPELNDVFERCADRFSSHFTFDKAISVKELIRAFSYQELLNNHHVGINQDRFLVSFLPTLESVSALKSAIYLKYLAEFYRYNLNYQNITKRVEDVFPLFLFPHISVLIRTRPFLYNIPVIQLYFRLVKCLRVNHELKITHNTILIGREEVAYNEFKTILLQQMRLFVNKTPEQKEDIANAYQIIHQYLMRKSRVESKLLIRVASLSYWAVKYNLLHHEFLPYRQYIDSLSYSYRTYYYYNTAYYFQNPNARHGRFQQILPRILENIQGFEYVYKDWVKQHHLTYINAYNEALACIYYQTSATPLGIYNELKKSEPQEDDLHSLLRNVIYMQLLYLADEQDALDKLIRTIRVLLAQKRYENLIDEDDKAVRLFMIILNDIIRFKQKLKIKEEKKGGQSYFNIYNKIVQCAPTEKDWLLVQLMSC